MKKSKLFFAFVASAMMGIVSKSEGQLVSGSVFLQGKYVEAGICANGDFGAASPPAGYHPHTTSTSGGALGFVADPAMDGWTVGTPAYTGDYFTPGSPFEGWNIQFGSARAYAHSCSGLSGSGLIGANTSYYTSGSKVVGVWEGSYDSVTIRQVTTLDTLALYFTLNITLINTSSTARDSIYYLRSVDPDNDQSWGGSFSTINSIDYQLPNPSNATVVSATGTTYSSAYVALGTADTNAKCMYYSSWPISASADLASVYSGSMSGASFTMGSTSTADIAIGLMFHIPHLAPVDSASDSVAYKTTTTVYPHMHPANQANFSYFYAFSPDAVDSALAYLSDSTGWIGDTSSTLGVASINDKPVSIFPNPSRDIINVSGLSATDHILLFDLMGRNKELGWVPEQKDVNVFSTQSLPSGSYVVVITDEGGKVRTRIPIRKL